MKPRVKIAVALLAAVMLLFLQGCGSQAKGDSDAQKSVLLPLYAYPYEDTTWDDLVTIRQKYPSLKIIAIINPSNGDFTEQDPRYIKGIEALNAVGIKTIGYVYTQKAGRPAVEVKKNIDSWMQFYGENGISGFFFDEASVDDKNFTYYEQISAYAKGKGADLIVLNPGAMTTPLYMQSGIADIIVTRETTYADLYENIEHFIEPTDVTKMALLLHSSNQDEIVEKVCAFAVQYHFDYLYATDHGIDSDRWAMLSSYFEALVKRIADGCN